MNKDQVIAVYGSHDASITFVDKKGDMRVFEYERFVKKRYAMFSSRFDNRTDMGTSEEDRRNFLSLIKSELKNEDIELILHLEINEVDKNLFLEFFPNAKFKEVGHHYAHACSGFYPTGYNEALIFSIDGGGWDNGSVSMTNVYLGKSGRIELLESSPKDFGNPYSGIGYLISEVTPSPEAPESVHALSYAGKIMGLCAYGKFNEDWLPAMSDYYDHGNLEKLCSDLGFEYKYNSLSGVASYDLAATSQYVFEEKLFDFMLPYLQKYNTNVVMVGGCGLNVLYNQSMVEYMSDKGHFYSVPPNPNDCGLSYGMFLSEFPLVGVREICYSGIQILDQNNLDNLLSNYEYTTYDYKDIVSLLKQGKILGVIRDNSEVGPRALGNRSIICDPAFDNMKDILNAKVKFREWFRPFAPVCRMHDTRKFFNDAYYSRYMSHAPTVKKEYREPLKTITHVDNTARLQTVIESDHRFFYGILTELDNQGHIPVILNTSFNIKGKPILTTYEDALYVLDNTELDYVVTDQYIISKKK